MRLDPETLKVLLDQELISKLGLLVRTQNSRYEVLLYIVLQLPIEI